MAAPLQVVGWTPGTTAPRSLLLMVVVVEIYDAVLCRGLLCPTSSEFVPLSFHQPLQDEVGVAMTSSLFPHPSPFCP